MKLKNNKGVTLIALVVTVIILLLITGAIIYNTKNQITVKKIDNLYIDLDTIKTKVNEYYLNYGELPVLCDYLDKIQLIDLMNENASVRGATLSYDSAVNPDDGDEYYVIDLEKLDGLTLNYGYDEEYKTVKANGDITLTAVEDEVYVVNGVTHQIYFPHGIFVDGVMYYTYNEGDFVESDFKILKPTDSSVADSSTTFSTNYGTIDVIWLSRTTNNVTSIPNAPILKDENGEAMTPVTWSYNESSSTWTEDSTAKSTWYSYNAVSERNSDGSTVDNLTSQWANAKTANGSYFVWIPRYAYRITYYESETSTEPTGYYDGYGMWRASDAAVKYKLDEGVETVQYKGNKYIVHPAFCDNVDIGGWDEDLEGFWFAKYEMSGSGSTTGSSDTLKSVPNVENLRNTSIGNQYRYARNANYGYTGTEETIQSNGTSYSHKSYMNSHMVKNSEWGAVAYLTQSQYGRNGNEIDINNSSSYITGNGGGAVGGSVSSNSEITNAYDTKTGAKASTTGNVYGIYDMSGGAFEYVASFNKLGNSSYVAGSSYGLYMTQEAQDSEGNYISTKYATIYSNETSIFYGNLIYTVGKVGEATKETYTGNSWNNWFNDYTNFVIPNFPLFGRGGYFSSDSGAGIFYSSNAYGDGNDINGFRTALCP